MRRTAFAALMAFSLSAPACSEDPDPSETRGTDSGDLGEVLEAEAPDTTVDSEGPDTESVDSDVVDTGTTAVDSALGDTSTDTFKLDTTPTDTTVVDTAVPDAFMPDTFKPDTFVADTFVADTFKPDTAPVDSCVANACGGCGVLANAPGTKCGFCSSPWTCSADKTTTFCPLADDRNLCGGCGTLTNAPGAACGTCGTLKYACTLDKTATSCPTPDDVNGCGGCGPLMGKALGAACGPCNAGTTVCFTTTITHCKENPAVANLGSPCGFCMTYQCSGPATTCQSAGTVFPAMTKLSQTGKSTKTTVAPTGEATFRFALNGEEQGIDVALAISRQQTATADPASSITIALVAGSAGSPEVVSSVTVPATSIPFDDMGTPALVTYAFSPSPTTTVPWGDGTAHIRVTASGSSDVFYVYGVPSVAPLPYIEAIIRPAGAASYSSLVFTPAITLRVRACL